MIPMPLPSPPYPSDVASTAMGTVYGGAGADLLHPEGGDVELETRSSKAVLPARSHGRRW